MQLGLYIDIKHGSVLPNDQFDFIEENVQTLLVPEADEAAFRERLAIVKGLGCGALRCRVALLSFCVSVRFGGGARVGCASR